MFVCLLGVLELFSTSMVMSAPSLGVVTLLEISDGQSICNGLAIVPDLEISDGQNICNTLAIFPYLEINDGQSI